MTDGCVQFSKDSWHYKITHFVFPALFWSRLGGINLCPYMRAVIASIFSLPFVYAWRKLPYRIQDNAWVVQAELVFLAIILMASAGLHFLDESGGSERIPPFWDLVGYGFLGGNLIGIIGGFGIAGAFALKDYIQGRPKKDHKTRGLIKTYMQSKHDKICPCVEFEE